MSIEQKINYQLNKHPFIKRKIKRIYQRFFYIFSKKIKYTGKIKRISPGDGKEYFFGYYDNSPWDSSGRYILCMQANDTWSDVSPNSVLNILLLDSHNNYRAKKIAESRTWNVQMGCMAQWLGPDFKDRIIYNDFRNGNYCSVILNIRSMEETVIQFPIYSVSKDGKIALSLDFSRLYSLRPGYGYYNIPEVTKNIGLPDTTCIWKINLENGVVESLLKYTDFSTFMTRNEMSDKKSIHKVNHIMINPSGDRFMVLYRWFVGARKYTRLITCNIDGSGMYLLNDDDMVSHCFWKNDKEILAFENKKNIGTGYFLMTDQTKEYVHLWSKYTNDGHPSYSPNKKYVITDSYPDRKRIQEIKLLKENDEEGKVIVRVFSPFKYDNDTRCDLHPRWSRDNKYICFDSVFEGHRELYICEVDE